MRSGFARLGALAVAAALAGAAVPALGQTSEAFRRLRGPEIKARFTGMEFTDGQHFAEVFGTGGALDGTYLGRRKSGSWRVGGDELCLAREREAERCLEVWLAGRTVQLRPAGFDDGEEGILRTPSR